LALAFGLANDVPRIVEQCSLFCNYSGRNSLQSLS
jgi:hypothetical protein